MCVAPRAAAPVRSVRSCRPTGLMRAGAGCGCAMRSVGDRQWYMHTRRWRAVQRPIALTPSLRLTRASIRGACSRRICSLCSVSSQQAALLQSVQRSRRVSLGADRARQTNSRSYPFIISGRCARHGLHFAGRCASGRAMQAGQVRAEQLPILVASATADTSLETARRSQAAVHAV